MNNDFGFLPNLSDEDKLFIRNIEEWVDLASEKFKRKFTHFLTEKQCDIATAVMNSMGYKAYGLCGGWDNAKRRVLGIWNEYDVPDVDEFPIASYTFKYPKAYKLSHRDFLGAFVSLNIKRECVGDILVNDGIAVAFFEKSVGANIDSELFKIGRVGVDVTKGCEIISQMDVSDKFTEISGTVASLRLDCVLSLALNCSRSKVVPLIAAKKVCVNNFERLCGDYIMHENDVFSVKGFGKFVLSQISGKSRKDRIFITVSKYI